MCDLLSAVKYLLAPITQVAQLNFAYRGRYLFPSRTARTDHLCKNESDKQLSQTLSQHSQGETAMTDKIEIRWERLGPALSRHMSSHARQKPCCCPASTMCKSQRSERNLFRVTREQTKRHVFDPDKGEVNEGGESMECPQGQPCKAICTITGRRFLQAISISRLAHIRLHQRCNGLGHH